MDVSENSGTPKSSILIGFFKFSIRNHPFWGTPILETPIYQYPAIKQKKKHVTTILLCQAGHLRSRPHETFCKFAASFFLIRKSCIPYEHIAMRIVGAGWWWYKSPYEIAWIFVWDVIILLLDIPYTSIPYIVYLSGKQNISCMKVMKAVTMSLEWLVVTGVSSCNLATTRGHILGVSFGGSLAVPGSCWGSKVAPPSISKW